MGAVRKTRPPDTTGTEADNPGTGAAHFTPSVFENFAGRLVSGLDPSWFGPRKLGQSAAKLLVARMVTARARARARAEAGRGVMEEMKVYSQESEGQGPTVE